MELIKERTDSWWMIMSPHCLVHLFKCTWLENCTTFVFPKTSLLKITVWWLTHGCNVSTDLCCKHVSYILKCSIHSFIRLSSYHDTLMSAWCIINQRELSPVDRQSASPFKSVTWLWIPQRDKAQHSRSSSLLVPDPKGTGKHFLHVNSSALQDRVASLNSLMCHTSFLWILQYLSRLWQGADGKISKCKLVTGFTGENKQLRMK